MTEPVTEIASILATGLRRLHARSALCIDGAESTADSTADSLVDSSPDRLEVIGPLPLHGPAGLTAGEGSAAPAEPVETTHEA